jgi:hypothetical protein
MGARILAFDATLNPMKRFVSKLIDQAGDLAQSEPVISLFVAAALAALFFVAFQQQQARTGGDTALHWRLYRTLESLLWAAALVAMTATALALLRGQLHQTLARFQFSHGRITQANYNAVQTIWGAEQVQRELQAQFFYDEEVVERIESEDITKPAVLRKKIVRHHLAGNPFISTRHHVALRQNPRRKGSALYGGYETSCRFEWKLKNPGDRDVRNTLTFPLPAAHSMYDELTAVLNGVDILPQIEIKESALVLSRDSKAGEAFDFAIGFKSRGMSTWYFQVGEAREIRDFTLSLSLLDLTRARLNYPEGCMSPSSIQPTPDGNGSILTYRLDHALSNKGMGIALPELPQPGATTSAVVAEAERGWLLIFALLLLSFSTGGPARAASPRAILVTLLFGAGAGLCYGLLADLSDLLFGFWATASCIALPLFASLAFMLTRMVPSLDGKLLALQFLLYGIVYPILAGIDPDRQSLYLNICALIFLGFVAWKASRALGHRAAEPNLASAFSS